MTEARLARGDLPGLDALDVDALALPLFAVRAQPRAVAGYVDWRLCGRIARLLQSGRFGGKAGEALLMPTLERVGAPRLFLLGLGPPVEASKVDFSRAVQVLADAQARKLAFGAPLGAEPEPDPARHQALVEGFLTAAANAKGAFDQIVVLDPDQSLAEAGPALGEVAKRAGLEWGG